MKQIKLTKLPRARKPAGLTEADLARYCQTVMACHSILGWRQNLGGIMRSRGNQIVFQKNPLRGFPDYAGVTNTGHMWALEIKTAKGIVSSEQKHWHNLLADRGVIVGIARDMASIDKFFRHIAEINRGL